MTSGPEPIAPQKLFYSLTRFLPGGTQNLFGCRALSPWLTLRDDFTFLSRNVGPGMLACALPGWN
jgi:hypothetical protein